MIWAKSIPFDMDRTGSSFYPYAYSDFVLDPDNSNSFIIADRMASSTTTTAIPTYTYVTDNGVDLIVNY